MPSMLQIACYVSAKSWPTSSLLHYDLEPISWQSESCLEPLQFCHLHRLLTPTDANSCNPMAINSPCVRHAPVPPIVFQNRPFLLQSLIPPIETEREGNLE